MLIIKNTFLTLKFYPSKSISRCDLEDVVFVLIAVYLSLQSTRGETIMETQKEDKMTKFDSFIGKWELEYNVPESIFSKPDKGTGKGEFKRELNNKYVIFNYSSQLTAGKASAHGIFAWDEKIRAYRYWWFEDSGSFMTATCNFINENILFMNWENSLLIQTFTVESPNKIFLSMDYPSSEGKYIPVLEVVIKKR